MDCREAQELLTAYHDGELHADGHGWPSAGAGRDAPGFEAPAADRARVEDHLRGCPECAALLADLARADQAAGVPDPGPAYWDRFNARVMDRVEREAGGPDAAILRPKHGWMRQPLRYLVPAAAVAALVVGIVRYGGMPPGAPTMARDGQVPGRAGTPPVLEPRPIARDGQVPGQAGTPPVLEPRPMARDGQVPGQAGMPRGLSPRPTTTPSAVIEPAAPVPAGQRVAKAEHESLATKMAESAEAGRDAPGSVAPAGPSCELAHTLAERERFREAEAAQRACLAGVLDAPSREKGLVFLAELLDRQARYADADAVIAEIQRQFPESQPLDLYLRRRPMVQKRQE